MKTNKLILTTVCAFLLTIPAHAQFNTIGTFNSKHIKTNNPPKSNETLTDSISLPESMTETDSSENVYSMFPGTVIKVGQDDRSGKFVTVRTGDYTISYCHLSQQFVKANDFIVAGTTIAISGNTGASTGPHLHITAKKDGKAFDAAILLEYIKKSAM